MPSCRGSSCRLSNLQVFNGGPDNEEAPRQQDYQNPVGNENPAALPPVMQDRAMNPDNPDANPHANQQPQPQAATVVEGQEPNESAIDPYHSCSAGYNCRS